MRSRTSTCQQRRRHRAAVMSGAHDLGRTSAATHARSRAWTPANSEPGCSRDASAMQQRARSASACGNTTRAESRPSSRGVDAAARRAGADSAGADSGSRTVLRGAEEPRAREDTLSRCKHLVVAACASRCSATKGPHRRRARCDAPAQPASCAERAARARNAVSACLTRTPGSCRSAKRSVPSSTRALGNVRTTACALGSCGATMVRTGSTAARRPRRPTETRARRQPLRVGLARKRPRRRRQAADDRPASPAGRRECRRKRKLSMAAAPAPNATAHRRRAGARPAE